MLREVRKRKGEVEGEESDTSTRIPDDTSTPTTSIHSESNFGTITQVKSSPSAICDIGSDFFLYQAKFPANEKTLIGIHGSWYDVTTFKFKHPGGQLVMDKFAGKDASEPFKAFHEKNVLKGWRPVGSYDIQSIRDRDPCSTIFMELHDIFVDKGFFNTSYSWYAIKIIFTFSLLLGTIIFVKYSTTTILSSSIAGVMLGCFWQQCGFLMHDMMHNEVTHNRHIDRWLGTFFGSVLLGASAHWWRDEHFEHHAFLNVVEEGTMYVDPQMQEETWVQSRLIFPLYWERGHPFLDFCQELIIKLQHILWMPLCVFAGRFAIVINAMGKERRWYEWIACMLHLFWIGLIMSLLPDWKYRVAFYLGAAFFEGVLHVQLLTSHYAKPWNLMKDVMESKDWYRIQIESNLNITCPLWFDWFHGGLNYHIEHHLYPNMPRHNFRAAREYIKSACIKAGVEYDECCWSMAVWRTLKHLKQVSDQYIKEVQLRRLQKSQNESINLFKK